MKIDINSIQILARQRAVVTSNEEWKEFKNSIKVHGLISPIQVRMDNDKVILIAGNRRLTAMKELGMKEIPVTVVDVEDSHNAEILELIENTHRSDMSWSEICRARAALIKHYREKGINTQEALGDKLGVVAAQVAKVETIQRVIDENLVATIYDQSSLKEAFKTATEFLKIQVTKQNAEREHKQAQKIVQRKLDEEKAKEINSGKSEEEIIKETNLDVSILTAPVQIKLPETEIINASFLDWMKTFSGDKFDVMHTDFPYGDNYGNQSKGKSLTSSAHMYDDSPDIYKALINGLIDNFDKIMSDSCHLYVWHSPKFACWTREQFKKRLGLEFNWYPLIWSKDAQAGVGTGFAPSYEMCLFLNRNRKIAHPVRALCDHRANKFNPLLKHQVLHDAQKDREMLHHFFIASIDTNTRFIDPTCGCGNSVRTAAERRAKYSLGIEIDPAFAQMAKDNCETFRPLTDDEIINKKKYTTPVQDELKVKAQKLKGNVKPTGLDDLLSEIDL